MTARIISLTEKLHDVQPPDPQLLGPDVTGTVESQLHKDYWTVVTVSGTVVLRRMAATVYLAVEYEPAALTALEAQGTGYTLYEWLDDAGRRATWNGLDADTYTLAGTDIPARLGLESERVKSTAILDRHNRLVTLRTGEPVEKL